MTGSSSTAIAFKVDREVQAGYLTIRPHGLVDRQKQIGPGTILDLDDEGNAGCRPWPTPARSSTR